MQPTTSGTVGQTIIKVSDIIDHALRRSGSNNGENTVDNTIAAKQNLFFSLASLTNEGINLWTVEKAIIGLIANQARYYLPIGTQDILKGLYRTVTLPSGGSAISSDGNANVANCFAQDTSLNFVQSATNGWIAYNFGGPIVINNVGILAYNNPTLSLVWETSQDGITWTNAFTSPENQVYAANTWYYNDIEVNPAPISAPWFRVRETNGGTLSVVSLVFGSNPQETTMGRMNMDMYFQQNRKADTSTQPVQWWYDRQINPQVVLWETPSNSFAQYVFWRTRMIQDVGQLTNILEIPTRWIDAIVDDLALRQLLEDPKADLKRITMLEKRAMTSRFLANSDERDPSDIQLFSDNSAYTR